MEAAMSQVIPDFLVEAVNGELILSMNNRDIPDLKISREYAEMFQDYTGNKANQTSKMREAVQFVKQKLDSAQWFYRRYQTAPGNITAYDGSHHPPATGLFPDGETMRPCAR